MVWVRTCTVASAQSTSSPSIQIFSVGAMGISEPFCDGLADGRGRPPVGAGWGAGELAGADEVGDRLVDAGRCVGLAQKVEHEAGRPDGRDRVRHSLAGDDKAVADLVGS